MEAEPQSSDQIRPMNGAEAGQAGVAESGEVASAQFLPEAAAAADSQGSQVLAPLVAAADLKASNSIENGTTVDAVSAAADGQVSSTEKSSVSVPPPAAPWNEPSASAKDDGIELANVPTSSVDSTEGETVIDDVPGPVNEKEEAPPVHHVDPNEFPDGGYGWLVVIAAFLSLFWTVGGQYAWGTYIRYFWSNDTFPGTSYLTLSFLSSLTGTGFSVLGPFAGRWADRFGPFIVSLAGGLGCGLALILGSFSTQTWHILLSQGLMFGCFETLIYLSAVNAVSSWFLRRRGTAFGLAVAGSGIGGFAVTPTAQSLIDALDWRWSLRVIAFVIMGVSSLCSLVYLRVPPSRRRKEIERRASMKSEDWELAKEHAAKSDLRKRPIKIFDITYFKDVNFTILYVSSAIGMFGYFSWFAFSPSYAVQFGISPQTASLILAITNMGSAVGRIALGWAGDKLGYLNAYVFCQVMTPVICLFWPLATAPGGLFAIGLLYGLFAGGYISLLPVMMGNTLFPADPGIAGRLGMQMSSTLVASIAGTPIAGAILDRYTTIDPVTGVKSSNFTPMILYAGIVMLLGNGLNVIIKGNMAKWTLKGFMKRE